MRRLLGLAALFFACSISADDRSFVKTAADGLRSDLVVAAASNAPLRNLLFTLVEGDGERWPAPVAVHVTDAAAHSWDYALEGAVATKQHTIRAASGSYQITFSAPHHRQWRRDVRIDEKDVDLGAVRLRRNPLISGIVHLADGSPLVGSFVTDRARLSTKTDAMGAFSLEADGDWPASLEVSFPGLATKRINVPKAEVSAALPPVTLSHGSRLTLALEGVPGDADIDLAYPLGINRFEILKTAHLKKISPRFTFEDLDKGDYVAVVRGAGPLQRLAAPVKIGEAEVVERTIRIEPITVDIELHRGQANVPAATITVLSEGQRWVSPVQTDSDGRVQAEAWQRGPYAFAVSVAEGRPPAILFDRIDGTSVASVHLELPDRAISGRVVDEETGSPIATAKVLIESVNDDATHAQTMAVTDADGKFIVDSVADGTHTLTTNADGYLPAESTIVLIDQATPRREVKLRASRGVARQLRVITRKGIPLPGAEIIEMIGSAVTATYTTDDTGSATIKTMAGRDAVAYILPTGGSFAIARLASKPPGREESIVVPDGNATLELHANDSNGKPLPHVHFVLRYDGEIIPENIAFELDRRRGIPTVTGSDGVARMDHLPAGFLELWPVRTRDEVEEIVASGGRAAPLQVALKEGVNVASMTFTRRP